jgi:hypothetical protein
MKVYMISGKARNGKDTLAGFMKKYFDENSSKACIMHIGNYIKHFAIDYFGWDGNDDTKPRTLLQQLGTEIIREKMNKPLFFTTRLIEDMEVLSNFYDVIIVSDVRLPLEFDEIGKVYPDMVKMHITRPELVSNLSEKEQKHITETALDNYNDYKYDVVNTTLEELEEQAKRIVEEELR